MRTKGTISLNDLCRRLCDVCEGIERNGDIWAVDMGREGQAFILGPLSVCGRVLGLFDADTGGLNKCILIRRTRCTTWCRATAAILS
jgi:hypothetical protein